MFKASGKELFCVMTSVLTEVHSGSYDDVEQWHLALSRRGNERFRPVGESRGCHGDGARGFLGRGKRVSGAAAAAP